MRDLTPRPFWLIVKLEAGRMELLTTSLASSEETLPVFSFEEEAAMFLRLKALEADWRAKQTSTGELISVLLGPCAGVDRVLLDPLPGLDAEVMADLVGVEREAFIDLQLGAPSGSRLLGKLRPRNCPIPVRTLQDGAPRERRAAPRVRNRSLPS